MKKRLIDLHWEWMEKGTLNKSGLCDELSNTKYEETLYIFEPSIIEERELLFEGEFNTFWGSGLDYDAEYNSSHPIYTPRRQSIVLLICAIHGEI